MSAFASVSSRTISTFTGFPIISIHPSFSANSFSTTLIAFFWYCPTSAFSPESVPANPIFTTSGVSFVPQAAAFSIRTAHNAIPTSFFFMSFSSHLFRLLPDLNKADKPTSAPCCLFTACKASFSRKFAASPAFRAHLRGRMTITVYVILLHPPHCFLSRPRSSPPPLQCRPKTRRCVPPPPVLLRRGLFPPMPE